MVLGRAIFALKSTRPVHDVYSFVVGIYFLSGVWYAVDWTSTKIHAVYTRGTGPIDSRTVLGMLWTASKVVAKLTYFILAFGVLMPFTLGLIVELFVVLPLRNAIDEDTSVIFMVVRVCVLTLSVSNDYNLFVFVIVSASQGLTFLVYGQLGLGSWFIVHEDHSPDLDSPPQ